MLYGYYAACSFECLFQALQSRYINLCSSPMVVWSFFYSVYDQYFSYYTMIPSLIMAKQNTFIWFIHGLWWLFFSKLLTEYMVMKVMAKNVSSFSFNWIISCCDKWECKKKSKFNHDLYQGFFFFHLITALINGIRILVLSPHPHKSRGNYEKHGLFEKQLILFYFIFLLAGSERWINRSERII